MYQSPLPKRPHLIEQVWSGPCHEGVAPCPLHAGAKVDRERYEKYISSPKWAQIRTRIIRQRGGRCQACQSSDNLHVHHGTYDRFERELDTDLFLLCESCHDTLHRFQRFAQVPLMEATTRFIAQHELYKVGPDRRKKRRPNYKIVGGKKRYRSLSQDEAVQIIRKRAEHGDVTLQELLLNRALDQLADGGKGGL